MQKQLTREKVKPGIWRRRNAKNHWVYEITFRDSDGVQRRQTVVGGMREAQTALADVRSKMGKGERVAPNPRMTFAIACEEWIKAKSPNLTPKTISSYRYGVDRHLLPILGRLRLSEIDVSTVVNDRENSPGAIVRIPHPRRGG